MSKILLPPDGKLRAITVKEPFANLIVKGFKTIENKQFPFPKTIPLPVTLAIHASSDGSTIGDDIKWLVEQDEIVTAFEHPEASAFKAGKAYFYASTVIGLVDVVACVDISDCEDDDDEIARRLEPYPVNPKTCLVSKPSRLDWANGPYCLILDNPRRFKTGVQMRGQLNYWRIPDEHQQAVIDQAKRLLYIPNELPTAPLGGTPRFIGRRLATA